MWFNVMMAEALEAERAAQMRCATAKRERDAARKHLERVQSEAPERLENISAKELARIHEERAVVRLELKAARKAEEAALRRLEKARRS